MDFVRITDVSPRDGLQNEPGVIPTADKARLVELLCETGVDEIEVTSFVSPKWVPQLGDAGELLRVLKAPSQREGVGGGFAGRPTGETPTKLPKTLERAQNLRRNLTEAEKAVWFYLKDQQIDGVKFRRQHPFGPFILDFFSSSRRLAVEIDGETHAGDDAQLRDDSRTAYLNHHGIAVVRFTNLEALRNAAGVAETIRDYLRGDRQTLARGTVGANRPHGRYEPSPPPPPSGRGRMIFSALVPNERGMHNAVEIQRQRPGLLSKVSVFTAASETFAKKNTNATIAETIERFRPVVEEARANDLEVRGYISCVVACPFEGAIEPGRVAEVAWELRQIGVDELDLGDTIGAGTPETIGRMLDTVDQVWGIQQHEESGTLPQPPPAGRGLCTLHLHDTFGRAAACVRTALDLGVRSFDGSVAGLGGCPYASTPGNRAPGNIDTRLLVETIHAAGYVTGVDLAKLDEAAAFAREIVARSLGTA
jgi:hydroxymethylglutaryl-CoA lyase